MTRFAAALAILLALTTIVTGRPACCIFSLCCAAPAPPRAEQAPASCCKKGRNKPVEAPPRAPDCTCHASDTHAAPEGARVHAPELAAPFAAIPAAGPSLLSCPVVALTAGPAPPPTPLSLTLPLLL
ncbi:MAG: hypothetical protein ACT4PV_16400 [Planctomycetaceae bacterium]